MTSLGEAQTVLDAGGKLTVEQADLLYRSSVWIPFDQRPKGWQPPGMCGDDMRPDPAVPAGVRAKITDGMVEIRGVASDADIAAAVAAIKDGGRIRVQDHELGGPTPLEEAIVRYANGLPPDVACETEWRRVAAACGAPVCALCGAPADADAWIAPAADGPRSWLCADHMESARQVGVHFVAGQLHLGRPDTEAVSDAAIGRMTRAIANAHVVLAAASDPDPVSRMAALIAWAWDIPDDLLEKIGDGDALERHVTPVAVTVIALLNGTADDA